MNAKVILFVCSLVISVGTGYAEEEDVALRRWNKFKLEFNKSYQSAEEDSMRQELFFDSLRRVVDHNAKTNSVRGFKRAVNHLSDLKPEEFERLNGLKIDKSKKVPVLGDCEHPHLCDPNVQVPDSVDWRTNRRMVGPVKDQGYCGSCWAFATTGLLEGQERMNSTGGVVPLSEQNLVDCDDLDGGCHGGDLTNALEFIHKQGGIETEKDYPYTSMNGQTHECKFKQSSAFVTTRDIIKVARLKENEEVLKIAVATYGPVAVGIYGSLDSFKEYKSGVYYDEACNGTVNHAVLVVGYGTTEQGEDYWIIKNSWSKAWGIEGYAYLARNRNNHCGIATMPTVAIVKKP